MRGLRAVAIGLLVAAALGACGEVAGGRQVQDDLGDARTGSLRSGTAEVFECQEPNPVHGEGPPISDLAQQREVVEQLFTLSSVHVRHAAPTALGVVVLVTDHSGDADGQAAPDVVARLRAIGAGHVFEWDSSMIATGVDADGQVRQVLQWLLEPAVRDVRRATRGVPGSAGLALWQDAGAVLLQWKSPVPPEVLALAGVRPDGVRVIVEPVDHSRADVQRAQRRLVQVLDAVGLRDRWSSASACGDGSGLVVGIVPPLTDRSELQVELAEALGLPVMVVPEDRPTALNRPTRLR